jgi:hypothetical protein
MSFPHLRSKPIFLGFLVAGVAMGVSICMFGGDVSKRAQSARGWFAVPREDAASAIREFRVTADFAVHYFRMHRVHPERHPSLSI